MASQGRFLSRADILAGGGDTWRLANQNDSVQYFRKLKLEEVLPVPRPSCLPEDRTRRPPSMGSATVDTNVREKTPASGARSGRSRHAKSDHPFEVTIPLGNERMRKLDIRQELKTEYAARYLEKLGASPSPANMELILKHMPIEECRVQQVFRPGLAKTEKRNFISIQPMSQLPKKANTGRLPSDLQELHPYPIEPFSDDPIPSPSETSRQLDGQPGRRVSHGLVPSFDECKERFVYPYNLPPRWTVPASDGSQRTRQSSVGKSSMSPAEAVKARKRMLAMKRETAHVLSSEQLEEMQVQQRQSPTPKRPPTLESLTYSTASQSHRPPPDLATSVCSRTSRSRTPVVTLRPHSLQSSPLRQREFSYQVSMLEDPETIPVSPTSRNVPDSILILRETAVVPEWGASDIHEVLASFVEKFPFDRYWTECQGNERIKMQRAMDKLKAELLAEQFSNFLRSLAKFMYWTFIRPDADNVSNADVRNRQFLQLYEEMLILFETKKQRRQNLVDLPAMLLALRTGLQALMKRNYPVWSTSAEGGAAIARMDKLVILLMDPMDFCSRIAPIEASPEALRVAHNRKAPPRMASTFTSPIVRFIVAEPTSREAKSLLSCRCSGTDARKEEQDLLQYLSPELRANVLRLIAQQKLGVAKEES